jgi:hypothetical protein
MEQRRFIRWLGDGDERPRRRQTWRVNARNSNNIRCTLEKQLVQATLLDRASQ